MAALARLHVVRDEEAIYDVAEQPRQVDEVRHYGKFSMIPARAVEDDRLSAVTFRVLGAICRHTNKDGKAWPTLSALAKALKTDKAAVSRAIKTLAACGYLEVEYRTDPKNKAQIGSVYRVLYDPEPACSCSLPRCHHDNGGLSPEQRPVVTTINPPVVTMTTKTYPEKTTQKKRTPKGGGPDEPAAPNRPYQLFESFCGVRGVDPATNPNKGQILREASGLQKLGWTDNQILGCVRYLASDPFWCGQLRTLSSVKKHIADWHAQGEPEVFTNGRPSETHGSRSARPGRSVLTAANIDAEERKLAARFSEAEPD